MKKYKNFEEIFKNQQFDMFFYHLFNAKMPQVSSTRSLEYKIWQIKNFLGSLWYMYTRAKSLFNLWSTKYFPFSLFNQEKLYHYSKRGLRNFILDIEKIVEKSGYEISVINGTGVIDFNPIGYKYGIVNEVNIEEVKILHSPWARL